MSKKKIISILLITLVVVFILVILIIKKNKLPSEKNRNILCYPSEYTNQEYKPLDDNSFDKQMGTRYYFEYDGVVYYHSPETMSISGSFSSKFDSKINNSHPNSFRCIDANFAKDKNNVYYWGSVVEKADPETFEPLDWPRAKDKNYYFNGAEREKKVK